MRLIHLIFVLGFAIIILFLWYNFIFFIVFFMKVSIKQFHGQLKSEEWETSLLTCPQILRMLNLLSLQSNFIILVCNLRLFVQVHESYTLFETGQSLC